MGATRSLGALSSPCVSQWHYHPPFAPPAQGAVEGVPDLPNYTALGGMVYVFALP
jgi:hypothetical protein